MAHDVLQLVERRREPGVEYGSPFDEHEGFNETWWSRWAGRTDRWFEVRRDGVEVARVQLAEGGDGINPEYLDAPSLGRDALRVLFIEIHAGHRLRGVGTAVVQLLSATYPGRRLYAYSEADGFWTKLGWLRFEHPEYADHPHGYQVLFVQPA